MLLECIGKWRYLKGFSLFYSGMAIRQSVHVFTMLSTRLSMFGNQTFPPSSDLVLQTLDGLHVKAREIVFVVFPRRIRLPDVLSGNSPFIFSSKRKSAVSTDRCFLQDVCHSFGFPRVQFARLICNGLLAFFNLDSLHALSKNI